MVCPEAEDKGNRLQMWRVEANVLNEQFRTANRWFVYQSEKLKINSVA
jgi:hypothetical protein